MTIARNRVVSIDYTISGADGAVLDTTRGGEPMLYLHGSGTLVDELEAALDGKGPKDKVTLTLPPERAFGTRDEAMVFTLPREGFGDDDEPEVGAQVVLQGGDEDLLVTIVSMNEREVTVDGNHPFAGLTVRFDVEVIEVREASAEELEHGHAHDPGSPHAH